MKHSTTFKRVIRELDENYITEGTINAIKRSMHTLDRAGNGWSTSQTAPKTTKEEIYKIHEMIEATPPRIVEPQATKGITWLRNQAYTPKGAMRKHCPFNNRQLAILETFDYFTLEGFENISTNMCAMYVPIYKVHGNSDSFTYSAGSWQSGVNITIY